MVYISMKSVMGSFLGLGVIAASFGAPALANDAQAKALESAVFSLACSDHALGLADNAAAGNPGAEYKALIADNLAYWQTRKAKITTPVLGQAQKAYDSVKAELLSYGEVEMTATCAGQKMLSEVSAVAAANKKTLSPEDAAKIAAYEKRITAAEQGLTEATAHGKLSAATGIYMADITVSLIEKVTDEDRYVDYLVDQYTMMKTAFTSQRAAKEKINSRAKSKKALLSVSEKSLTVCLYKEKGAAFTAFGEDDLDGLSRSIVRALLWESTINFRRELGGQAMRETLPYVIEGIPFGTEIEPKTQILLISYTVACDMGVKGNRQLLADLVDLNMPKRR